VASRLERNKESARKCRQSRKKKFETLANEVEALQHERDLLKQVLPGSER
jgi:hypothetical protein